MKPLIKWRHQYDRERDELEGELAATTFEADGLTHQSFAEDADINVLAKRFGLDKATMPVAPIDPRYYGDFSDVPDLRTALDLVRDAENRFMDLPAPLRAKFDNSPAKMWRFVNDPDNAHEAVRLGLLRAPDPEPGSTIVQPEQTPNPEPTP